jgi:hypothetical protein
MQHRLRLLGGGAKGEAGCDRESAQESSTSVHGVTALPERRPF